MDILLLGLVEASHDGQTVPLGGAKPRALLAMLALHANTPVSADRLIEGLWGERAPATAPKALQVLVSQLRKQLARSDAEIITRGRGYELRVDPEAVDALRFERLLTSGDNGSHVREALALWRGPPLDDLADEPFAAPEIRRLEDLWLAARETSIDGALADGRHAAVLGEIDDMVREHPLREHLHGQRMLALYRSGRQADALEAFRHARQVLVDEVGLEPGPELRGLNDAILRQDPALDGPPARRFAGHSQRRPHLLLAGAAVAVAAAVALAVTQLGGGGGRGLDGIAEDTAGAIDPGSGRIVAQYSLGHAPDALAAGGGSVWAANGRDGTISRVDRGRGQVTTIDVGGEPTAVAYGDGALWVADGQNRRVDQVDPTTNRVVGRLAAGNATRGVAITAGAVWLTSAVDGQVDRLDLTHGGRIQQIGVPGGPAAIAAGGGAVWVAGEEDAIVTKLDPGSGAALQAIGVGNGPAAITVGYGGVWVANRDDGTVTRIDEATDAVTDTVHIGGSPVAIAGGLGAIWVADGSAGAVIRIDPRTRSVSRRIAVRSTPSALALAGNSVWAAATASRASHRGGTLRFESAPFDFCKCIDPAGYDAPTWPVLSLVYDGLVAYRRIPGAGGSTLVPSLAASIPQPRDRGLTYTFQLRSGLRFSDGKPVRPEDFRASIERLIRLSQGLTFYRRIVGVAACNPRRCDLAKGIETDAAARTITIHLTRPDTELMQKLAMPLAYVLPARTPAAIIHRRPPPGTGPYKIAAFAPERGVRLVRNARFRSWSAAARPDGYPDAIRITTSTDAAAQVAAVQHGRADAVIANGVTSIELPVAQARSLSLTDASHLYTAPAPTMTYLFVNVREPPFDDARVRLALNYAIDRRRVVQLAGGGGLVALSCQLIPPGLPGYAPTCPFTRDHSPAGTWSSPDLARARRLIAASHTGGARVQVLGFQKYGAVTRYAGEILRRLGYRVRVRTFSNPESYFSYVADSRHHTQIGLTGWIVDFLTPSSFFTPFVCDQFVRKSAMNVNTSQFCDRGVDGGYRAALAARGPEANARWAALDRRVLTAAPLIPLFTRRTLMLVSDRVGNAQTHQELGPLLDQFWVR
jgi:YVTN family beta-propeller protein